MVKSVSLKARPCVLSGTACPRCGGQVFLSNGEPSCLQCGWDGPTREVTMGERTKEPLLPSVGRKRGRCGKYL